MGPVDIVFVTTELSPWIPGGAGSVIARLRDRLTERGDRVIVLLVADTAVDLPADVIVVAGADDAERRSSIAAGALARLARANTPDLVEFPDFDGLGFEALANRAQYGLDRIPIQVRFHAPFDLVFETIGTEPPWLGVSRSLERSSLRMADRVVVPSAAFIDLVAGRYGVEPDRIVVGQPPVTEHRQIPRRPSDTPTIIALGRLGEQKGSHDLAVAVVPVLRSHPELRLVYIGEDGWSAAAGRPMRVWITDDLLPPDVADRVEFTGRLTGDDLDRRLAGAWAAVFPSRFETFSLAAHEARSAGLPIVVADLPAFAGLLDESTGALVYDGSREGLTAALTAIVEDETLRDRLAAAPLPSYDDPLAPYAAGIDVRHHRSQAGLGTAAVQRLERARPSATPGSTGWLQRSMRWIPDPVARVAVRVLPQALKDRVRPSADWRIEQDRRARAAREAALAERIDAGAFPELASPQVSVVIPCYNQGSFLDDAIRSVFEQTLDSFEVIVVDDGSTERGTVEAIDGLAWPRTTVVRQDNAGLPAARNTGMERARGTYVVPLDADDELEPRFLERLVDALDADPDAAFACCWARLFGDVDAVAVPRPYNPYQLLLSNSVVGCVVLRRDAWAAVGGYDETMRDGNEDWELWVSLMAAGWGVAEIDAPLFRYRKHGISMSVDTEARFEHGRKQIVDRHPDLYEPTALAARKHKHYPLVSVIAPEGVDTRGVDASDVEIVEGSPEEAIAAVNGKYVVHWSGVDGLEAGTLDRLADVMEDDDAIGAATTGGDSPLVVVRRWSLHDPSAPQPTRAIDDLPGSGTEQLVPGSFPDGAWIVPAVIDGVPVQRQPPEEEGRLPEWV
jgi:glycosyltransferase involved in cell wall biosynthesis